MEDCMINPPEDYRDPEPEDDCCPGCGSPRECAPWCEYCPAWFAPQPDEGSTRGVQFGFTVTSDAEVPF